MKTDVIVVGAGPVGLMLAGELRLADVDVAVVDRLAVPTGQSRALGFNRRAAESLEQRGLMDRLGPVRWGPMGHFGGVRFDLGLLPEDHSGILGLSQARLEKALSEWLGELGVPVHRENEVIGIRETPDAVVASLAHPGGRTKIAASYLVGCDGAGSTVRNLAGIGTTGRDSSRGMYTAEFSGHTLRPRPIGERLPGGRMVVATPLGEARFRIVIHDPALPARPDPGRLTFAQVADAWHELTGESLAGAEPQWVWACGNATALAGQYRRGRVLLAGDAAHEMPPLAAWGLSAGVQDAVNLGWKLAAQINGWAPAGLLDTYHTERHPIGARLIRNARAASMLYLGDAEMEPVREVMGELAAHPGAAGHLANMVSGLGIRYDLAPGTHHHLGRRIPPDDYLTHPDNTRTRLAPHLHPARPLLITTDPTTSHQAHPWKDRITTINATWTTNTPTTSVLVRPDGYIAWTDPGTDTPLTTALTRWFGTPTTQNPPPAETTRSAGAVR